MIGAPQRAAHLARTLLSIYLIAALPMALCIALALQFTGLAA